MFYSHQLLARKAPLGQIWMAATLDSKIKRRSLDKLDIARICEEILNPSVPMALRLSGILMGGIVNVYKRKVDVLYDDVNRFLVEINRAYMAKSGGDHSTSKIQAKGRAQARSEAAITIQDEGNVDVETLQFTMRYSDPLFAAARFQNMTLEDLDQYINIYVGDDEPSVQHHQADPADITLPDYVDLGSIHTDRYGRFEWFDLGDDLVTQTEFMSTILEDTPPAHPAEPAAPRLSKETASGYSPKHKNGQMEHTQMEVENQKPEEVWHQTEIAENEQVQRRLKKKARRKSIGVRIDEEMMISNETYQAWLSDASDIKSRMKRTKIIKPLEKLRSLKIEFQMDLPPLCLMMSSTYYLHEIHYPFMELWRKHTIGNPQTPPPIPQKQKLHLFPEEIPLQDFAEFGDFGIEIKRVAGEDQFNLLPGGIPGGSSGSLGGDASQPNLSAETSRKTTSDRSNIKRSSLSIGNLNTVAEDFPLPELAPLEETGPTPTPHPQAFERSVDKITESIRKQLKAHFDTPGNSQVESLNLLAEGLSRKRAALLFYQTCVMTTMDYVKVEQVMPYGDIIISRGSMM